MEKKISGELSRTEFAARLRSIAAFAPYSGRATALANAFNVRFPGMTITPYAARKWLMGEAIPTQERLVALAEWMQVDPAWLRFGSPSGVSKSSPLKADRDHKKDPHPDRIEYDLGRLTETERKIIRAALDAIFAVRRLSKSSPVASKKEKGTDDDRSP